MRKYLVPAVLAPFALAACNAQDEPEAETVETEIAEPQQAVAMLATADGQAVGTVTATAAENGVDLKVEASGMPPGLHGVHVHATGLCDAPAFESAGGHWNPQQAAHGLEAPAGQHAGDMPNLEIGEDGNGSLTYTLGGGATFAGLMDADGSAFVVHAGEDDQTTDPSGDSGDRIACGVFATDAAAQEAATAG